MLPRHRHGAALWVFGENRYFSIKKENSEIGNEAQRKMLSDSEN